jgi:peptidoglycan/LPS O-acetylase OafA/YrhL
MRGVAVGLVLLAHVVFSLPGFREESFLTRLLGSAGVLGVNIFFALSGYLITTLLVAEKKRSGRIDLKRFYVRRTQRIFPAFYVYLATIALLGLFGGLMHVSVANFAIDALYLHNFGIGGSDWYTGHSWSLDIEEQFYLIWPALTLLGLVFSTRFALCCVVLEPLVRIGFYHASAPLRAYLPVLLFTHVDVLMCGCAVALAVSMRPDVAAFFASTRARSLVLPAFAILLLSLVPSAKYRGLFDLTIGYTLAGVLVAFILPTLVSQPQCLAARVLATPALAWFGRISYSVYLWQQLFLTPYRGALLQNFPIDLLATIAAGAASYYFIERRFFRAAPIAASTLV